MHSARLTAAAILLGAIDPGEDCDHAEDETAANLGGATCASLGHGGGQLACDAFCQFDFTACTTAPPSPTPAVCVPRDATLPTPPPTHVDNGDSCAIAANGSPRSALPLLPVAALIWARRRRRAR